MLLKPSERDPGKMEGTEYIYKIWIIYTVDLYAIVFSYIWPLVATFPRRTACLGCALMRLAPMPSTRQSVPLSPPSRIQLLRLCTDTCHALHILHTGATMLIAKLAQEAGR